jgi:hypothetical protein
LKVNNLGKIRDLKEVLNLRKMKRLNKTKILQAMMRRGIVLLKEMNIPILD